MGAEASGAASGAAAGTAVAPGIGTAIGAAAGGAMSLIEASKQAAAKNAADRAAQEAVARAEQELETEFLGAVQVPTEAYKQALRESTAQQMQSINALQEGDSRLLAGGLGRVDAVGNDQINQVTNTLADRLYNLDIAQANEKGQNASDIAKLYSARAEGAQEASMAANLAEMGLKQGALSAFGTAGAGIANALTPVYRQGEDEVVSQLPKMPGVMIPEPQAPALDNSQLQDLELQAEVEKTLQMLMKNPELLKSLKSKL
jgi:preprotein translocase subunit YajC